MAEKEKATEAANSNPENKDTHSSDTIKLLAVRNSFLERPKTMRQVAEELREERSNICWYVGMMRDADQIAVHHQGECETTGRMVNYYTTDRDLFPTYEERYPLFANEKGGEA